MQELITALCAAGGALTLAILGWLSSSEPFDKRKFAASVITAIVAGIGISAVQQSSDLSVIGCFLAYLSGAGADASRKAVAKKVNQ
jgi:hypothetical protein|tara:strand:- start:4314 stop:4571 length:258 start_codon:yes stop_codon:yes gene_type:complete